MSKVMFFDVDGPMISERARFLPENIARANGWPWRFDPCAVSMLNFVAWAVPDLEVVIASHRLGMSCSLTKSRVADSKKDWEQIFKANDLGLTLHKDWVTPRHVEDDEYVNREKHIEISEWLKAHPSVTHFVTLEDDLAGYDKTTDEEMEAKFHLAASDPDEGMTFADLLTILDYFGIENYEDAFHKYQKHISSQKNHETLCAASTTRRLAAASGKAISIP